MLYSFVYKEYFLNTVSDIEFHLKQMLPYTVFLREDYNEKVLREKISINSKGKKTYVAYVYNNNVIAAFSLFDICEFGETTLLHMKLVVTDPKAQSKGAYKFLFKKRLDTHLPTLLIGRFHNPRVYETLFKLNSTIYPDIRILPQKTPPNWVLKLLRKYAEAEEYDAQYSIAKNIYINKRKNLLHAKDENINNYYIRHVGLYDALVVVVMLNNNLEKL